MGIFLCNICIKIRISTIASQWLYSFLLFVFLGRSGEGVPGTESERESF